jgi:uncharacterized membrane protein
MVPVQLTETFPKNVNPLLAVTATVSSFRHKQAISIVLSLLHGLSLLLLINLGSQEVADEARIRQVELHLRCMLRLFVTSTTAT